MIFTFHAYDSQQSRIQRQDIGNASACQYKTSVRAVDLTEMRTTPSDALMTPVIELE